MARDDKSASYLKKSRFVCTAEQSEAHKDDISIRVSTLKVDRDWQVLYDAG